MSDPALRAWTDVQREAWSDWVALAAGMPSGRWCGGWQRPGAQMRASLQASAAELVAEEAAWTRAWNDPRL